MHDTMFGSGVDGDSRLQRSDPRHFPSSVAMVHGRAALHSLAGSVQPDGHALSQLTGTAFRTAAQRMNLLAWEGYTQASAGVQMNVVHVGATVYKRMMRSLYWCLAAFSAAIQPWGQQ